jgi:hypothetical protein
MRSRYSGDVAEYDEDGACGGDRLAGEQNGDRHEVECRLMRRGEMI